MSDDDAPRTAEHSVRVEHAGRSARAVLRVPASAVAGAPVEASLVFENLSDAPLFLAVGASRVTLRPDGLTMEAELRPESGGPLALADPFSGAVELGGPAGVVKVEPGTEWPQPLLLNEFVRLENARDALAPGGRGALRVRVRRPLPLASGEAEAFRSDPGVPVADLAVEVALVRDDAALAAAVD
ncbi:MAG: hypothetical protein ABW277_24360, partial [Longimicrobiaceae bacterium]